MRNSRSWYALENALKVLKLNLSVTRVRQASIDMGETLDSFHIFVRDSNCFSFSICFVLTTVTSLAGVWKN